MNTLSDFVGQMKGACRIEAVHVKTGETRLLLDDKNLVVDLAYRQLASLIGGDLTNNHVTKIAFGSNGTAADHANTGVTHLSPQVWLSVTTAYPTTKSVLFSATWAASVQNTSTIREIGLFCADNTLIARKAFQDTKKSTDWTWTLAWTLQYT